MPRLYLVFFVIAIVNYVGVQCMSREQLKKSGKLMKNSCMPKNDVTEEMVGSIEQGKFIDEKNVRCYIACVYQMGGSIKKGKFDVEATLKQIDMMFPPELKEPTKKAMQACKDVGKNLKDVCDLAFSIAKCVYEQDPAIFFFP